MLATLRRVLRVVVAGQFITPLSWGLAMVLLLEGVGCVTSVRPLSYDYSQESRQHALELAIGRLEHAYSFTEHKRIDWAVVRARLADDTDAANGDVKAYERALRRLVSEMPDGHVLLWHETEKRNVCPEAAGTLGAGFADTDSQGVVVVEVDAATEAADAGIALGDRLVAVDEVEIETALAERPMHCFPVGLATNERRRQARVRLLGRAPLGSIVRLTFERASTTRTVDLEATADGHDVRRHLNLTLPTERVSSRMIEDDIGYVEIGWEDTLLTESAVRRAINRLWKAGARQLVIDLRNNDGGTDQSAANIAGMFTDREWFYETITMYDRRADGQVEISEVWVEPQELLWTNPSVVLINGNTVSSGEGMAMMFARLDIPVVGFEGTAASFGSSGSKIKFPGGWELVWPAGRSLDVAGRIQLDSDHTLEGGVHPTHRIPWTSANQIAYAADPRGFVIDYAIEHVLEAR